MIEDLYKRIEAVSYTLSLKSVIKVLVGILIKAVDDDDEEDLYKRMEAAKLKHALKNREIKVLKEI